MPSQRPSSWLEAVFIALLKLPPSPASTTALARRTNSSRSLARSWQLPLTDGLPIECCVVHGGQDLDWASKAGQPHAKIMHAAAGSSTTSMLARERQPATGLNSRGTRNTTRGLCLSQNAKEGPENRIRRPGSCFSRASESKAAPRKPNTTFSLSGEAEGAPTILTMPCPAGQWPSVPNAH